MEHYSMAGAVLLGSILFFLMAVPLEVRGGEAQVVLLFASGLLFVLSLIFAVIGWLEAHHSITIMDCGISLDHKRLLLWEDVDEIEETLVNGGSRVPRHELLIHYHLPNGAHQVYHAATDDEADYLRLRRALTRADIARN